VSRKIFLEIKMDRREVLSTIPKAVNLYIIHSEFTRLPYIECDDKTFDDVAFFFDIKENADKKSKELLEKKQKNTVVELNQEGILRAFTHLVIAGVDAIKYNCQGEDYVIQLNEIVKLSDFSDLPPEKRPVENRTLQLTMLYFAQEIRANIDNPNTPEIHDMEEEMMVNILKARFLVPVREVEVEGQTQMQMLMIKLGENGGSMIPVFTDNIEFDKMPNDETVKKTIIDAKSLINFPLTPECDGFLINPMGVSLPLNAGIVNNLKNMEITSADKE
jgi:hypothetical protein